MFVCMCSNVTSTALELAIKETPIYPSSPYSRDYISSEDQIYQYVQDTLNVGTGCSNCELFIRQFIRDRM